MWQSFYGTAEFPLDYVQLKQRPLRMNLFTPIFTKQMLRSYKIVV